MMPSYADERREAVVAKLLPPRNLMRFNGVENISLGLYDNALSLDRVLAFEGL